MSMRFDYKACECGQQGNWQSDSAIIDEDGKQLKWVIEMTYFGKFMVSEPDIVFFMTGEPDYFETFSDAAKWCEEKEAQLIENQKQSASNGEI